MDHIRFIQNTSRLNNTPYIDRFSTQYPELFKYALKVEKYPDVHLDRYSPKSGQIAIWQCSECPQTFEASWVKTTQRGYVHCEQCCQKRFENRIFYNSASRGNYLHVKEPHIFKALKSATNEKQQNLDITKISHKAHSIGAWECQACQKDFTSIVRERVKAGHVYCSSCSKTGQSLFEYEIASLLETSLETKIITHHSKLKGVSKVDIYIPKIDMAIQLDPYWSHRNRIEQDKRNHVKHKAQYKKVIRFREQPLQQFDNSISLESKTTTKELFYIILNSIKMVHKNLTPEEYEEALRKANTKWDKSFIEKENNLSTQPFFKEFIKNLDHPGRDPKSTGGGSADRCLWQCDKGHEWETTISTRSSKGRNCPECFNIRRKIARPRESIAELFPESINEFIENLSSDRTPTELRATAADVCIWKCHICGTLIKLSVESRASSLKRLKQGRKHLAHMQKTLVK